MKNTESKIRLEISPEWAGQRLDKALSVLAELSRARLQALMAEGHVTLEGKTVDDASRKVREGEVYALVIPPVEPAEPEAQDIDLKIIYEDKDVLVIDKPAGLVVHPAPGNRDKTLVNALLAHCGETLSGIGGVARPGIVHRLDKDTSGLIVVAKNDLAHQKLSEQFADRSLSRTYQALVIGVPPMQAGIVDAPIGRHLRDRKKMGVVVRGKPARTHYRVLEQFEGAALIECKLETGRTHQIRVHFSAMKHPCAGDQTYGADPRLSAELGLVRQWLHAHELGFPHPVTGEYVEFVSDYPEDLRHALELLRDGAH